MVNADIGREGDIDVPKFLIDHSINMEMKNSKKRRKFSDHINDVLEDDDEEFVLLQSNNKKTNFK